MDPKRTSSPRYLGCSGNVPIFSDNLAAAGDKPKTDDQEQPTGCSDTKEEQTLSTAA
jgi:hypothetical protein